MVNFYFMQGMSEGRERGGEHHTIPYRGGTYRYDTLPAQVYISGTSVKKIIFWCF